MQVCDYQVFLTFDLSRNSENIGIMGSYSRHTSEMLQNLKAQKDRQSRFLS